MTYCRQTKTGIHRRYNALSEAFCLQFCFFKIPLLGAFRSLLLFLCFTTLGNLQLYGQQHEVRFQHISIEDGLSHSLVNAVYQDSRGFLWVSTGNGLNCYDGLSFKIYKSNSSLQGGISHNTINLVYEDRKGNLWVGTANGGLNRYVRETDKFLNCYNNPSFFASICDKSITALYESIEGTLWVGTSKGLFYFDKAKNAFAPAEEPGGNLFLANASVTSFAEDKGGNVLIGTLNYGLLRYNHQSKHIEAIGHMKSEPVTSLLIDNSGRLWIGTLTSGLYQTLLNQASVEVLAQFSINSGDELALESNHITCLMQDGNGYTWIGTPGGLHRYSERTNTMLHLQNAANDPTSLSNNYVTCIFEDRSHILWVGTFKGGLNKNNQESKKFVHYKNIPSDQHSIDENLVYAIFEDSYGRVWIGGANGCLDLLDRNTHIFTHLGRQVSFQRAINNQTISAINEDADRHVWVGTSGSGIFRIMGSELNSERTNQFRPVPIKGPDNLATSQVKTICRDNNNSMWIATLDEGLFHWDYSTGEIKQYAANRLQPYSLASNALWVIYKDYAGDLWTGSDNTGLYRIYRRDWDEEKFINYRKNPTNPNSIISNSIRVIYEDFAGILWLGTEGGLVKVERNSGIPHTFSNLTENNGLCNNTIFGIVEDNHRNLWISTDNGLSRFNPQSGKFKNYTITDGLQSNEFNAGAYFKCRNGEIFFGGINGLTAFFPDSISDNPTQPIVEITGFKLFNEPVPVGKSLDGQEILRKSIGETDTLVLSYRDNVFSFEFIALHFAAPDKNKYAYVMEGFNDKPVYTDSRNRTATFTNLKPGKYIFRVIASNSDEVWNIPGRELLVIITPPIWQTWYAYLLYLLCISLIIRYSYKRFVRLNHRRTQLRLERLETQKRHEVDQLKIRFFSNISHEFRTPLTLILGPLEKLLGYAGEMPVNDRKFQYQIMQRNAQRLLRLINQLLDFQKLDSGEMKLQFAEHDLLTFIRGIMASFASLSERKEIKFQLASEREHLNLWFDADKLEKAIFNILSNAFKFTPDKGQIKISVKLNTSLVSSRYPEGFVEIEIKDNGTGIPAEDMPYIFDRFYQSRGTRQTMQDSSGIGLALTKELVSLHKGEITVESVPSQGSSFTIKLPLGNTHFSEGQIISETTVMEWTPNEHVFDDKISIQVTENEKLQANKNISILLVEDNSDMRAFIKDNMDEAYEIYEAIDGEEGWQKAIELNPEIIVSDVMMPKMDGFELCTMLKNDHRTSHIPVILLTARSSDEFMIQGLKTGADDYISKPFNFNILQIKIDNLVDSRRKLRERFKSDNRVQPRDITVTTADEKFLQKAMALIEENMSNPEFDVEKFGDSMGVSRMQLYRKLMALTNLSANQFIRTMRLKRAAQYLEKDPSVTISEVMYQVGFSNRSYFTACFQEMFQVTPKEYAAKFKENKGK
jgi:signal transduction histidine kinase/ligand-binding sensor domain-containing protein/DNA-binding response OmpR family regulator